MIESLKGIHETVRFKENSLIRLYNNTETLFYPVHWHTPIEIIMPISSTYNILCANEEFHLEPYDILLVCPGIVHSLGSDEPGERIIFQVETSLLSHMKEFEFAISNLTPAVVINKDINQDIREKAKDLVLGISQEYNSDSDYAEISIYSKFMELLVLFGRNCQSIHAKLDINSNKNKDMLEKIHFACAYINEHCSEDLRLEDIATLVGFSKYHFERQFKTYTNFTFYKYLTMRRIFMAEQMLITDDYSITEIALKCGFLNISTFIRMFKITNGCTPTQYKKNLLLHHPK